MAIKTHHKHGLLLALTTGLFACSGEESGELGRDDAGAGDDAGVLCEASGSGTLVLEIVAPAGAMPEVNVASEGGAAVTGSPFAAAQSLELPGGAYTVDARRVRTAGTIVGAAYQPAVEGGGEVCVRDGESTTVRVVYTEEPGSQKLWLTNGNAPNPGEQIVAFSAEALAAGGEQAPAVTLDGKLTSPSALRVDAKGRLWVGQRGGSIVGFATERLGTTSTDAPDIVLEGPALCGATLPCGPRAFAFDREGALWVALLERIVKLPVSALEASGEPEAEVTITSPDATRPVSLAFDTAGNLWVGEEEKGAVVKFAAARLTADVTDEAADVVIFGQEDGPVEIGLGGPDGLAFDRDGNLWVGYWGSNVMARYAPGELAASGTLEPAVQFKVGALALPTDLAIDESGNLWLPGSVGTVARIDADQLLADEPEVVVLRSEGVLAYAEKIALHSVPGPLFVAP